MKATTSFIDFPESPNPFGDQEKTQARVPSKAPESQTDDRKQYNDLVEAKQVLAKIEAEAKEITGRFKKTYEEAFDEWLVDLLEREKRHLANRVSSSSYVPVASQQEILESIRIGIRPLVEDYLDYLKKMHTDIAEAEEDISKKTTITISVKTEGCKEIKVVGEVNDIRKVEENVISGAKGVARQVHARNHTIRGPRTRQDLYHYQITLKRKAKDIEKKASSIVRDGVSLIEQAQFDIRRAKTAGNEPTPEQYTKAGLPVPEKPKPARKKEKAPEVLRDVMAQAALGRLDVGDVPMSPTQLADEKIMKLKKRVADLKEEDPLNP